MKKAKGFTLIELIVVMAIFGIIMFGALQLIPPIMKMMVQADVHESGNAAVSSISGYLEGELSTAEYLIARNSLPETMNEGTETFQLANTAYVEEFVKEFYEGVLKSGSTETNPSYGSGKVHVLLIDNRKAGTADANGVIPSADANGKISEIVYDVQFDIASPNVTFDYSNEYAVNKAYYDNYTYEIKCGTYDDSSFDLTIPDEYNTFVNNLSSRNTTFSIRATTHRNNTDYSFVTNSTMSLVNIFNLGGNGVSGAYFVINESYDPVTKSIESSIVDITKGDTSSGTGSLSKYGSYEDTSVNPPLSYQFHNSRQLGLVSTSKIVKYTDNCVDGYCFIYSYGSEINTQ